MPTATFAVILAAAGQSRRFGSGGEPILKKPFVELLGKPVWRHSADMFSQRTDVKQLLIALAPGDEAWFCEKYAEDIKRLELTVVIGGKERADSVRNALNALREGVELVAIHDAARPCLQQEMIDAVFESARATGAAIPATPISGTIKRAKENRIEATVPRENLWEAQTPQVFRRDIFLSAFQSHGHSGTTDDAAIMELAGYPVCVVPSSPWNIKITNRTDLTLAERILSAQNEK